MFFFFNNTATADIYTLSLHDALPIWARRGVGAAPAALGGRILHEARLGQVDPRQQRPRADRPVAPRRVDAPGRAGDEAVEADRKSTRLNSSHANISYAVFCLKKKNTR